MEFRIDIEDVSGNKLGSGPITSASQWKYTARMDRAGDFEFTMPASDPKALAVQKKRVARAYALLNGVWTEVGAGIIDRIEKQPQADGLVVLRISGDDLIRELTYRSVLNLTLYDNGNAVSHATALAATGAYAPAGWTFTPDSSPPNDSIYGYFNGETVLAAMVKIADKSQNHFYRGTGRTLVFASSFAASGVRAIQATGDLAAETCAIVSLAEQIDTYDLITRIYPRGSGNANVQLTLRATNRSAPSGYTLSTASNYIENDSANSTYGRIERQVDFRDIGPVANTDADVQAASNMLFDAALEYLKRNSTELEQATYTLQIASCSQLLRPMQSIRVVYRDTSADLNINTDLNILEATWQVDTSGIYTTDLVVSNADRWPSTDVGTIADSIADGHVYQALPQLNANSYVTAYNKNVDVDHTAEFRFRFGNEVTQLQQVLFEFQLLPFESTIRNISTATTSTEAGGGATPTTSSGGSATPTSSSGGSSTPTTSSGGGSTPTTASGGGTTSSTDGSHTHTVTIGNHTHSVTIPDHTHTVTIGSHTHNVTTNDHTHGITVHGVDNPTSNVLARVVYFEADNNRFVAQFGAGNDEGESTASGGGETVSSASGGSSTPTTSSGGGSTPTTSNGGSTTPTSASGGSHSHTVAAHTHTVTIPAHTHTVTIDAHTHTVTIPAHDHTVTIPDHTHVVTANIETVYGIFRDEQAATYVVNNLQYQVNNGGWNYLEDDVVDAGDGWYQLDITSLVMNATTFRPVQTNNLLEMRAGTKMLSISYIPISGRNEITVTDVGPLVSAGFVTISGTTNFDGTYSVASVNTVNNTFQINAGIDQPSETGNVVFDAKATIDAQLSVRNTIQAIAYT